MPKLTTFKGKSRWPLPVYVATLATGEVARCSFWSPSDKPLDIARGRAVAAYECSEDDLPPVVLTPVSCRHWQCDLDKFDLPDDFYPDGDFSPLTKDIRPFLDAAPGQWKPLPPKIPAEIVSGHVEYGGEIYADPMTAAAEVWPAGEAQKKRKAAGPTPAEMRAALQDIATFGARDNPLEPIALARIAAAALQIPMPEAPKLRAVA